MYWINIEFISQIIESVFISVYPLFINYFHNFLLLVYQTTDAIWNEWIDIPNKVIWKKIEIQVLEIV